MPDDRTTVTELATALGTLGDPGPTEALGRRPPELRIDGATWDRLATLHRDGRFAAEFATAFANGRALLEAEDALAGRHPRIVEWTGGRRPPGDEVAPIDVRIDHVYLVSCKYRSDILANASPGRLFDGLLATTGDWDRGDWFATVAPAQHHALYRACRTAAGLFDLPPSPERCDREQRHRLRVALADRAYPDEASRAAYTDLCRAVSAASAERWRQGLRRSGTGPEAMVWRLLRIGNAPYFVLGVDRRTGSPARFRIAGPWDWRDEFELVDLQVKAGSAAQPRVDWTIRYRRRRRPAPAGAGTVRGHVEIRWSHGRFAHPPEAKVYLDTPMAELPGYHPLGGCRSDEGNPVPADPEGGDLDGRDPEGGDLDGRDPEGGQAALW